MVTQNGQLQPFYPAALGKRMLLGGGIALFLVVIFLAGAGEPNPEWPKFWMLRPLIVVPLAGAVGGACYYILDRLSYKGGWRKVAAIALSVIVYIIGLWMGTVLGFAGTMWN